MDDHFFQIELTQEQVEYARDLVQYSMDNHKVPNIWDIDESKKEKTFFYRFVGSLGEVAFADAYGLPRHKKSFGASDGQDYGNDFILEIGGCSKVVDLKSMHRINDHFRGYYVLNIPEVQLNKANSQTELYYCISIHKDSSHYYASFLGYMRKEDIISGKIGILYSPGTIRTRADGSTFKFISGTYEIDFKDFIAPPIYETTPRMSGFKLIDIYK